MQGNKIYFSSFFFPVSSNKYKKTYILFTKNIAGCNCRTEAIFLFFFMTEHTFKMRIYEN